MAWIDDVLALRAGDACEWRYPAVTRWMPGTVVYNDVGAGRIVVRSDEGERPMDSELVRAPGGPDPYSEHAARR